MRADHFVPPAGHPLHGYVLGIPQTLTDRLLARIVARCQALPGADLFEPSDCEFYLKGRLEGLRGKDYRSPVMTDIERMSRFHHCEEQYIFGPTGFDPHP